MKRCHCRLGKRPFEVRRLRGGRRAAPGGLAGGESFALSDASSAGGLAGGESFVLSATGGGNVAGGESFQLAKPTSVSFSDA